MIMDSPPQVSVLSCASVFSPVRTSVYMWALLFNVITVLLHAVIDLFTLNLPYWPCVHCDPPLSLYCIYRTRLKPFIQLLARQFLNEKHFFLLLFECFPNLQRCWYGHLNDVNTFLILYFWGTLNFFHISLLQTVVFTAIPFLVPQRIIVFLVWRT